MENVCNIQNDLTLLEPVFAAHEGAFGSLISILQEAQDIYGFLPDDVLNRVAERTGNTIAQVRGVATFYAQFRFRPVGKYMLQICRGTACHVNGSERLVDTVANELGIANGETTGDGLFSLNVVACLGCCSLSPVITVNGEVYSSMTPDKVRTLLRELREKEAAK